MMVYSLDKKYSKSDLFSICLLIISPFLSLLYSLLSVFLYKKISLVKSIVLSASISILLAFYPPMFDTIANYPLYKYYLVNFSFDDYQRNFYHLVLSILTNYLSLEYYSLIILSVFFMNYVLFNKMRKSFLKVERKFVFPIFILCLFIILPRNVLDLNRFTLAAYLLTISSYSSNYFKKIILCVTAVLIHSSLFVVLLIFLVLCLFRKSNFHINPYSYILFLLMLLVSGFLISPLFFNNISFIETVMDKNLQSYYPSGNWGIVSRGTIRILIEYSSLLVLLFLNYFCLLVKYQDNALKKILIISSCLTFFFFSFRTISERFMILSLISGIIFFLRNIDCKKKIYISYKKVWLIAIVSCFIFLLSQYQYRYLFDKSYDRISNFDKREQISNNIYKLPTPLLIYTSEYGFSNDFFDTSTYK